ncbi:MAG: hypothetical protein ACI4IM_09125 [Acutalibacteraceae bacterium]
MSGFSKRIGILLLISAVIVSYTLNVGAISDNGLWEDSKLCVFLEADGESNSDLCFAAVKVKYDRSVHRIYLLFMLEFDDFNDDLNSGVIMNFNGMGEVTVMSDGTAEYNDNVYFAELNDESADNYSMNIMLETTVGIKSGIPDNLVMDVRVIDTNGVKSNTYSVDISEDAEDEPDPDEEADSTQKTGRTTKAKTTKPKTTKVKTTKVKTTRSKKSTTQKDDAEDEEPQTVINTFSGEAVTPDNGRKRLTLALGAAAAVIAVAAGCAAGIKNRKKDESKKDK